MNVNILKPEVIPTLASLGLGKDEHLTVVSKHPSIAVQVRLLVLGLYLRNARRTERGWRDAKRDARIVFIEEASAASTAAASALLCSRWSTMLRRWQIQELLAITLL